MLKWTVWRIHLNSIVSSITLPEDESGKLILNYLIWYWSINIWPRFIGLMHCNVAILLAGAKVYAILVVKLCDSKHPLTVIVNKVSAPCFAPSTKYFRVLGCAFCTNVHSVCMLLNLTKCINGVVKHSWS